MPRFIAVAFTHEGAVRPANEDTIAVGQWVRSEPMAAPERHEIERLPALCLVADGMGGHAAGEVASRTVAEHLITRADEVVDATALRRLIADADQELHAIMRERPSTHGMGTTVAGVAFTGDQVLTFNVGDSRVYGLGGGRLLQLSTDDTPGPKLEDGRTAARTTSLITQTLGGGHVPERLDVHVQAEPVDARDGWLIASDGLTDLVDQAGIEACLGEDDAISVRAMFEAALARGGRDNISIILVRSDT
jgi:serine/threonine protein phosphatase PrpC